MNREKTGIQDTVSVISYVEGQMETFHKSNEMMWTYRVYENGKVGIYSQNGKVEDEIGYRRATENLSRERSYPYELETGVRARHKEEKMVSDVQLKELAEAGMAYLKEKYPQYIIHGSFQQRHWIQTKENSLGMNYLNSDACVSVHIEFKHVDSKDLADGAFDFSLRDYDPAVFCKMADDYLGNFEKEVELPEELIIDSQYYSYVGQVVQQLDGEKMALQTSLLSGKVGEKVFSDAFTLYHDVTDEETWFNTFWDGEGHVTEGDRRTLIENGTIVTAYTDKRSAEKYGLPYTGNAYCDMTDLPRAGGINARIKRSAKTVKELLDGRYAIVLLKWNGWFNDKGEITVPVTTALLTDGEKILGKLPPFTFKSTMFDMFGKDFIGVGCDQPIFNDKQLLFRVHKE